VIEQRLPARVTAIVAQADFATRSTRPLGFGGERASGEFDQTVESERLAMHVADERAAASADHCATQLAQGSIIVLHQ
jgi:hypothetical protein